MGLSACLCFGGCPEAEEGALKCGEPWCGQVLECVMLWHIWWGPEGILMCVAVVCHGQCVCLGCVSGTVIYGFLCAWNISTHRAGVVSDCGVCGCVL